MSGNERKLSARQERAVEALLAHPTICAAAKAAGIGESTLRRWCDDPHFQAAHQEARARLLESVITGLQSASTVAVATLREVMETARLHPSARVSAARTILEMMLRSRELLEIERRLTALEEAVARQGAKL